ncbi:MFS transporter [candidate division LCP-89 bacterium B3_LCP]|uniref:MFS transporter n=1 Tax=candidate division LCP-89 bacterium B3_LCP TaxID=2012998 RepID=A0A532V1G9_UNCL8|nr:MAG: MFS transporter [candidate division LCP-89 bacterium B3_LCP]
MMSTAPSLEAPNGNPISRFLKLVASYPTSFWIANTMEIFERMAWYGFFSVSSLYITASVAEGGLGFTSEQRGTLQAVIPFILYLLPVLTGALGDRFGYKKTFFVAYTIMVPSYFLLGQVHTYEVFFFTFLMLAVGAATFKPVVTGTIARVTTEKNSAMGFGIFYMMVNVGAVIGPLIVGKLRGFSWDYMFYASTAAIGVNFIWLLLFYKEPTTEAASAKKRSMKMVFTDMVEVLGNTRFFLTAFTILVLLMLGSQGWLTWKTVVYLVPIWLAANLMIDIPLRKMGKKAFLPPMKLGNWRFALYLLILSGFWTSFNQIWITMPEYIRDFVNTQDMLASWWGFFSWMSTINPDIIVAVIKDHIPQAGAILSQTDFSGTVSELYHALLAARIRIDEAQLGTILIQHGINSGATLTSGQFTLLANELISIGRQVNPEYLIKFDATAIVLCQIIVSYIIARWNPFNAMVGGVVVASIGIGVTAWLHNGWPVVFAIIIFAFGEMMASPKSQEYIGRIAPMDKKALYMGYYFWAVALGNLFGGILSGQLYGSLARDLQRPDIMWIIFAILGFFTAFILVLYDRLIIRKMKKGKEMV